MEKIAATLFDGVHAAGMPVVLLKFESNWTLELPDGRLRLVREDEIANGSDTDDQICVLSLTSGEQLLLSSPVSVSLPRAGSTAKTGARRVTQRIDRWVRAKRCGYASAFMLLCVPLFALLVVIPFAAREVAERLPASVERSLGTEVLRAVEGMLEPSRIDVRKRSDLHVRFRQFAEVAGTPHATLSFRRGMVNAFALPGGHVIVTDELIELMQDDEKVMAVIAHELGHVHHRHSLRGIIGSSLAVSVFAVMVSHDQLSRKVSDLVANRVLTSRYTREQEREADRFAVALIARGALPVDSFARALESLADHQAKKAGPEIGASYTASHPPTRERIEAARASR